MSKLQPSTCEQRQATCSYLLPIIPDSHNGKLPIKWYLTPTGYQQADQIRQVMGAWWQALFAATPQANAQVTGQQLAAIYQTLQQRQERN
ncbi:hypothetical protein OE230_04855 [Levilactobacillus brevis]|nr:hypothetical protein OE230_04855 [Levilactobacillus brevis]